MPKPLGWLGKFHSPLTHFPIALLTATAISELLFVRTRAAHFDHAARFSLWIGAIGALIAATLGWFFAGFQLIDEERVMTAHRWAGTATALLAAGLLYPPGAREQGEPIQKALSGRPCFWSFVRWSDGISRRCTHLRTGPLRVVGETMKYLTRYFVILFLAASPVASSAQAVSPAIPEVLTLSWCLERAREANPTLERAAAIASAAAYRVTPAGALDDPRLAYEASNIPTGDFDFDSTPLSGHQLGLRQKLPFPGLLANREKAAKRGAEASAFLVEDQRLLTDGAVEMAWAELGFAQQALDITNQNIALLRQLSATAESRYRVGTGLQQDVLRAQVELTALLQEQLRRDEAIERAQSKLVELLDLPPETVLPRTADLEMSVEQPSVGPLLESIEEGSARVAAARKSVDAAQARVRTAEIEGFPDIDLGIGYRVRKSVPGDPVGGDDFVSAGFTVRLPVDRTKWRARVSEQNALLRRAEAELRAVRAELVSLTRRAYAEFTRASSEEALLETGLVPQARQSLESSRSAYEVGRIEFLSLLDSQVRLLGAELRLVRAKADRRRAFAALEAAAGRKLR